MNNNEFGPDLVTNEKLLKENEALLVEIENYQGEVDKFDAMLKVIFCFLDFQIFITSYKVYVCMWVDQLVPLAALVSFKFDLFNFE